MLTKTKKALSLLKRHLGNIVDVVDIVNIIDIVDIAKAPLEERSLFYE